MITTINTTVIITVHAPKAHAIDIMPDSPLARLPSYPSPQQHKTRNYFTCVKHKSSSSGQHHMTSSQLEIRFLTIYAI
jgi:hypothetical protein